MLQRGQGHLHCRYPLITAIRHQAAATMAAAAARAPRTPLPAIAPSICGGAPAPAAIAAASVALVAGRAAADHDQAASADSVAGTCRRGRGGQGVQLSRRLHEGCGPGRRSRRQPPGCGGLEEAPQQQDQGRDGSRRPPRRAHPYPPQRRASCCRRRRCRHPEPPHRGVSAPPKAAPGRARRTSHATSQAQQQTCTSCAMGARTGGGLAVGAGCSCCGHCGVHGDNSSRPECQPGFQRYVARWHGPLTVLAVK